jgi:hypothetical protein
MWTAFQMMIDFNPKVQCEYTMSLKLTIKVSIVYQYRVSCCCLYVSWSLSTFGIFMVLG